MDTTYTVDTLPAAILFSLLLAAGLWMLRQKGIKFPAGSILPLMAAALIVRLLLMQNNYGHENDMNSFFLWAQRITEVTPAEFYAEGYFCDYPPGYVGLLWVSGSIIKALGFSYLSVGASISLKLFPILFDLACVFAVWLVAKKLLDNTKAILLAAFYAFCPAVLMDAAIWGQADTVIAFGLFFTVAAISKKQWQFAFPVYFFTLLIKPQPLIAAPLGLAALIFDVIRRKKGEKIILKAGIGIGVGLLFSWMVIAPFIPAGAAPLQWIIDKYSETMFYYSYGTVNALNLHYFLGQNWVALESSGYAWFGNALTFIAAAFPVFAYFRRKDRSSLALLGAVCYILMYLFGFQMHERYVFPAFILLLLAYIQKPDKRLLFIFSGMALLFFANCALVLQDDHLALGFWWPGILMSIAYLALGGYAVWVALDKKSKPFLLEPVGAGGGADEETGISAGGKLKKTARAGKIPENDGEDEGRFIWKSDDVMRELPAIYTGGERLKPFSERTPPLRAAPKDLLLLLLLTAVYGVIAFYRLGSMTAPETVWRSDSAGQQVVFDLGTAETPDILYYEEINREETEFTLEFSGDGETYSGTVTEIAKPGNCFRWKRVPTADASGRYVRLTARDAGLSLMEITFRSAGGKLLAPAVTPGAEALLDESAAAPEDPGSYTDTYFDEIYYPRTVYEYQNGQPPYENTHPPLGKVLMMFGVEAFGMNPFGWRFSGTVAGILMIPAIWLLALTVFKKANWALFAAFLLAADPFHLIQTRLATIDSYVVLFVILMYAAMFRYAGMSVARDGWRTLIPLGFAGVFTGLAIASKWTGFYAAAGIAVIFFLHWYRQWKKDAAGFKERSAAGRGGFSRYWWGTAAACLIFFIAVPFLIYYLSYIPHLRHAGGLTLQRFFAEQRHMFDYHAYLTATHPYSSRWYTWFVGYKPIWYYYGDYPDTGMNANIWLFANYAVWWAAFLGVLWMLLRGFAPYTTIAEKMRREKEKTPGFFTAFFDRDPEEFPPSMILIAYAAQLVPWILISRTTYLYHYFAALIFAILALVALLRALERWNRRVWKIAMIVFTLLVIGVFVIGYPQAVGLLQRA